MQPHGETEHLAGAAKSPNSRESMRTQAIEIDRARRPVRRKKEGGALDLWKDLAAGRLTLLDHFDRDGRRYILARCNDPRIAKPVKLSPRQRAVVTYVALGHSNKLIAYELGLSASTVSMQVAGAMSRLGVGSRVELVQVFGRVIASKDESER
jgi:DNA-binding CsgD family transcriptional regulator